MNCVVPPLSRMAALAAVLASWKPVNPPLLLVMVALAAVLVSPNKVPVLPVPLLLLVSTALPAVLVIRNPTPVATRAALPAVLVFWNSAPPAAVERVDTLEELLITPVPVRTRTSPRSTVLRMFIRGMMGLLIPFETAHLTRVRRRMPGIFGDRRKRFVAARKTS